MFDDKSKNKQGDYIKLKSTAKVTINKMKWQPMEWGRKHLQILSDQGLKFQNLKDSYRISIYTSQ